MRKTLFCAAAASILASAAIGCALADAPTRPPVKPTQIADEPGPQPARPARRVVRQQPPAPPPQAPPAVQQPPAPPPPPPSPWYFVVSAGALLTQDTSFNVLGITGRIDYGTGFHVLAGPGYRFNPWLAAELELGYIYVPVDSVTVNGLGTASADGRFHGFALFGNLVLTYPEWQWVKPYAGAGVGFVHLFDSDVTVAGVTVNTGSETEFAFQVKAGIDFRIAENVSLAPEYRFMWINTAGNGLGNTHSHAIGASLKFSF
jgi:opacity protein-like surface antigen